MSGKSVPQEILKFSECTVYYSHLQANLLDNLIFNGIRNSDTHYKQLSYQSHITFYRISIIFQISLCVCLQEGLRERKDAHWHLNRRQQDFIAAITLRNINKVRQLLENGINPNFRDGSGNFPVHIVCDLPFTGEGELQTSGVSVVAICQV